MIGRDPGSDIVITNDTVSAQHARLIYRQKQWWVEDLGSTNGTYLNEDLLETAAVIITGDTLRFGEFKIQISLD